MKSFDDLLDAFNQMQRRGMSLEATRRELELSDREFIILQQGAQALERLERRIFDATEVLSQDKAVRAYLYLKGLNE